MISINKQENVSDLVQHSSNVYMERRKNGKSGSKPAALPTVINRRDAVTAPQATGRVSASTGLLCKHQGNPKTLQRHICAKRTE